jgi:hypothetical protein
MTSSNEYGSFGHSTPHNTTDVPGSTGEEQPLLRPPLPKSGWRKKMMATVHRERADVVLLLCYIITGVLDSTSISTWGSFVSMQTGPCSYITYARVN